VIRRCYEYRTWERPLRGSYFVTFIARYWADYGQMPGVDPEADPRFA
jgi:hypothetical protein